MVVVELKRGLRRENRQYTSEDDFGKGKRVKLT